MSVIPPIDEVVDLVRNVAIQQIMGRFNCVGQQKKQDRKQDGSLVTDADFGVQEQLRIQLSQRWQKIALLGEEMSCEQQIRYLQSNDPIWILDPLDGTSNFIYGIPFFSVSLALIVAGQPILGVVYDPVRDECYTAQRGFGAQCNGQPIVLSSNSVDHQKQCIAIIDFKRLPVGLSRRLVDDVPFGSQRNFGSCALEWAWLASGRAHLYLHGRQNIWDLAAGLLLLQEVGGKSCTFQGQQTFSFKQISHSVIAASDPRLFVQWRDWVLNALS